MNIFLLTRIIDIAFEKLFWQNFKLRSCKSSTKNSQIPFTHIPQKLTFYQFALSSSPPFLPSVLLKCFASKVQMWCPLTLKYLNVYFLVSKDILSF